MGNKLQGSAENTNANISFPQGLDADFLPYQELKQHYLIVCLKAAAY
jgi:hypothetical protein